MATIGFFNITLILICAALILPALVLFTECFMAMFAREDGEVVTHVDRPAAAVLIPAHNEELTIGRTLECLRPQLNRNDRLVVVADMCSDRTTEIARKAGATVIERYESDRRGKGYALEFGLHFLAQDPPQVVVIVDADCVVLPGAFGKIVTRAIKSGRPVQARYWMEPPLKSDYLSVISAFAFMVKNVVRPLGLYRLGLPCPLMGTGMAFPWSVIGKVELASGNLVEDLQLGVDLALAGYPPLYLPNAEVSSCLPKRRQAAMSQRRRWEHGHLSTIIIQAPRLAAAAFRQRRVDLLAMALDVSVPPLSLIAIMGTVAMGGALIAGLLGESWIPACLLGFGLGLVFVAVSVSWIRFGRTRFPARAMLLAPVYVVRKLPLYVEFVIRRQRAWIRTERENDP